MDKWITLPEKCKKKTPNNKQNILLVFPAQVLYRKSPGKLFEKKKE